MDSISRLCDSDRQCEITALYAISGEYDLIAIVTAESTEELSRLLDDIANLEGIERTNSSVILETKFARGMPFFKS